MLMIKNLSLISKKDLRVLIKDFSFNLNNNDKVGLIGEEGNGKSTLLKAIYDKNLVTDYIEITGEIIIKKEKLGFLQQIYGENILNLTCEEYINKEIDFTILDYNKFYNLMDLFKLDETKVFNNTIKIKNLSGGEKVKFFLLIELIKEPTILLLDEPSNDLDIVSLKLLENIINKLTIPVVFISHDEIFLRNTANRIILIESLKSKSEPRATIYNTNYETFLCDRKNFLDNNLIRYKKDQENFSKKLERYSKVYNSVNHALSNVPRNAPNVGKNLKDKMHSLKSMERRFEKEKKLLTKKYEVEDSIILKFDEAKTEGNFIKTLIPPSKIVLDLNLSSLILKNDLNRILINKKISLFIKGNKKIFIIGENGVGKTTLLKEIIKEVSIRGFNYFYMSQNYEEELNSFVSPLNYLKKDLSKDELTRVSTYLGSLKLTSEEMNRNIASLSGGEKAKIFFAKMVLDKKEVLILDEPTRNISPLSIKSFINAMKNFNGTIIAISHDRQFIYEVADEIYLLSKNKGLEQISKEFFLLNF